MQHFEKIGAIFKQVSNDDFFAELDHAIDRKFGIFQDMLNVEEKAIRLSSEHIKQTMGELSKAQRDQRDLGKLYSEMLNGIGLLNQNLKEINTRMSEQYNRLLDISSDKIHHLDKTLSAFDEKIERFGKNLNFMKKQCWKVKKRFLRDLKQACLKVCINLKKYMKKKKY